MPDSITVQDLIDNTYRSTPRNKLLADFFKDLGLIEKYGSGVQRIINFFKKVQLPVPEFRNISDGFMVTVFENVTENVTEKRVAALLKMIQNDSKISTTELANLLEVTRRTIARDIDNLKLKGILRRIGSAKGGHWEITINKV